LSWIKFLQPTTQDENLFLITAGPVPPNPTELLETKTMGKLLEELRKHFDYIIIDTPPVGLVPDAMSLMKLADTTLYVIRQRFTDRSALEFIKEFSEKTGIKNICIEINDMEATKLGGPLRLRIRIRLWLWLRRRGSPGRPGTAGPMDREV
jgi:tyrosine-protein kinase Etk/Wzc